MQMQLARAFRGSTDGLCSISRTPRTSRKMDPPIPKVVLTANSTSPIENSPKKRKCGANEPKKKNKMLKLIKISAPHIALAVVLMGYLFAGAFAFQFFEKEEDWKAQKEKARKIKKIYAQYADTLQEDCDLDPNDRTWKAQIYKQLEKLSSKHENRNYVMDWREEEIHRGWSNQQAVLYALSILSTTGYSHVMPITKAGQTFAMLYGLIGIPLMVLCAVDIGRFFSDVVLGIYSSLSLKYNTIRDLCGCSKNAVADSKTNSELVHHRLRKKSSGRKSKEGSTSESPTIKRASLISLASIKNKTSDPVKKKIKKEFKKPPLWAIFGILLLFLTLGGNAYICYSEQDPWTAFVEGVFTAFNLIANLTMGEGPGEFDTFTVCYIVFFVTFGLAVLTMCADLAASHLKWVFMKIHYFGRQIRRRRKRPSPEVNDLLEIIKEIRRLDPQKEIISFQDILEFMEVQGIAGLSRTRRNTIAYQPNLLDSIKFADDEDGSSNQRNKSPTPNREDEDFILALAFKGAHDQNQKDKGSI